MSQQVETEEEAIKLAEAFLEQQEQLRKQHYEEYSNRTGRTVEFIPYVFTLIQKTVYEQAWILKYQVDLVDGQGAPDPGIWTVAINKITGEAKFPGF